MISIFSLIDSLRQMVGKGTGPLKIDSVEVRFLSPSLNVDVVSDSFEGMEDEGRLGLIQLLLNQFSGGLKIELQQLMGRLPVSINCLTHAEFIQKNKWISPDNSVSWVSSFLGGTKNYIAPDTRDPKFVHFYGYKGGQGRSTVLAMLAKSLADDGYKILVVDADIEAPSLDLLFEVTAATYSQTLMGLCGWSDIVQPVEGAHTGKNGGRVDILPCRPRVESADLDFALMVANAPMYSRIYEKAAAGLSKYLKDAGDFYDAIIIDHRTGIASSVLPIVNKLRGSIAIFSRLDANINTLPSDLRRVVRAVFSSAAAVPGAFVSFSLDPNKRIDNQISISEARLKEELLEELAFATEQRSPAGNPEISPSDVEMNWVEWYFDRSLLGTSLPTFDKLQTDNVGSIRRLRDALSLPVQKNRVRSVGGLSVSGGRDVGQFISIPEINKLFSKGNPYSYILGRKGTGKTRLLKELRAEGLGLPLLVAADESDLPGLRSQSIEAMAWLDYCDYDPNLFWWSLLVLGLRAQEGGSNDIGDIINDSIKNAEDLRALVDPLALKAKIVKLSGSVTFLIDGLETLVESRKTKAFVSALFELMSTVQNDSLLCQKLVFRLFVRDDLALEAVQNVEQQMEGRSFRLHWSAASILNFAVSRLPELPWIANNFPHVIELIEEKIDSIKNGGLSEQEATELLLKIFPERIRRNNLSTTTFLKLYFSDAGGDDTDRGTFYPRLYLTFLRTLDNLASESATVADETSRLDSLLLNKAYDFAAKDFINETKQELNYLLALEEDVKGLAAEDMSARVSKFIAAFDGLSTPFQLDSIVEKLCLITGFTEKSVRESLQKMKAIRMFEERPGYAGWWRVGQLYKTGLVMRYVRSGSAH